MTETRKKYDEEFKKRAVRMCFSSKRTVMQVAESLGISYNMLYAEYNALCVDFCPDGYLHGQAIAAQRANLPLQALLSWLIQFRSVSP